MNFDLYFLDPYDPNIQKLGNFHRDEVLKQFEKYDWNDYLVKMDSPHSPKTYYSPSFQIYEPNSKYGLTVSLIEDKCWYVFFMRPKLVKRFFGLSEKMKEKYITDIRDKSEKEVREYMNAFINGQFSYIRHLFGDE